MGLKPPPPPVLASHEVLHQRLRTLEAQIAQELPVVTHHEGAPKKERHYSESTMMALSLGKWFVLIVSVFSAGAAANERVGKVLIEQEAIKREQIVQRTLLLEAVTKEYFAWKMEQASQACFTRAVALVSGAKVPVICPRYPTRGQPYVCHFDNITSTQ